MLFIFGTLLLVVAILLYKLCTSKFDHWKNQGVPYPKPLPLVGNYLDVFLFRKSIGTRVTELYNEFDTPYFGTMVAHNPQLVLRDPELVKAILLKDFDTFDDHAISSGEKADLLMSKVLFFMRNPEWKAIRGKVTHLFTPGKMRKAFQPITKSADDMIGFIRDNLSNSINAKDMCAQYLTDAIAGCAFGIDAKSFDAENAVFKVLGTKLFHESSKYVMYQHFYYFFPGVVDYFKLPFTNLFVSEFITDLLWKVIEDRKKTNVKRHDSIDAIMELLEQKKTDNINNFSDETMLAQSAQFFIAGFETTSTTMSYALYELCLNPDIQRKLREEIIKTAESAGINYQSIQEMKYLNMVLCETLRKYPVLPVIDRRCNKKYNVPNTDIVLEEGSTVLIPVLGLHRDPNYFPEPERFNPERFSEENKNSFSTFAYMPFGIGPRTCIGERLGLLIAKLAIVRILMEYDFEPSADTPIPVIYDPKHFLLLSAVGIPLKFKKLEN